MNDVNLYPNGLDGQDALNILISYLLGNDWYVVDPLSPKQVNEVAVYEILNKYSKKYRKEQSIRKRIKEMSKKRGK